MRLAMCHRIFYVRVFVQTVLIVNYKCCPSIT